MPSLAAGSTFSQAISGDQRIRIQTNHNQSGRLWFVPENAESPPVSTSRSFGPLAIDQTFGPWGEAGTINIVCDAGSTSPGLTYTVVDETAQAIVASAFTQTAGAFSSTGAGAKTLTASGTGSVSVGATGTGTTTITRVNSLSAVSTDSSGTPGNATNNNLSGRAAFAAAASTVVITNSQVTAASKVFISLGSADATLTSVRVTPAAGSFTVTGNAAATGTTVFDFLVVN